MALPNGVDSTQELLDAQTLIINHILNYVNSFSLKCVVQLGIPNVIHKHGEPMTLSQLSRALPINKEKSHALYRLMRILVHSKIFDKTKILDEEAYSLTSASRLLLRDEPLSYASFVLTGVDQILMDSFNCMIEWFEDENPTPFHTRFGGNFWEFTSKDEKWNQVFNDGMDDDARFMASIVVTKCSHVFEGLKSVVDVGGGTGALANAVADVFPDLEFTVLDLPHVVSGLKDSKNVKFVSGDMFEFIPPAQAVFLKSILHDWSDEDCVKTLKKCKDAIPPKDGKVIILDIVVGNVHDTAETQLQLSFDMVMMVLLNGKERTEKEWANLFYAAGFKNYKINPIFGVRSIIELFL